MRHVIGTGMVLMVPCGAADEGPGATTKKLSRTLFLVIGGRPLLVFVFQVDISGTDGMVWKSTRAGRTEIGGSLEALRAALWACRWRNLARLHWIKRGWRCSISQ